MKYSITTLCLFLLIQFIVTIEIRGQESLNISMCLGSVGTLTIPDCDDDDDCCIVWYDNSLPEGENKVGYSCSHNVINPSENKSYRIVITKDNFGEKYELSASATIIDPEDINVSIRPLHKCYTKGAPISIEDFEISSNVEAQLGGGVIPSIAPEFDQEVATSIHEVLYSIPSCAGFQGLTEPVELSIVNPDIVTSNGNPRVTFNANGIIKKINSGLKFLKAGACGPYIAASQEYETTEYNLCCKDENDNPEGKIITGESNRIGYNGEVGIRCGGSILPPIKKRWLNVTFEGFVGAGVELSFNNILQTTCVPGSGRTCFEVEATPKLFGEIVAEVKGPWKGANPYGAQASLIGTVDMPLARYCYPDEKWIFDEGAVCVEANVQVTVRTPSFYVKAMEFNLIKTKGCPQ